MNRTLLPATGLLLLLTATAHAQPGAESQAAPDIAAPAPDPSPHAIDIYALIDRAADELGKEIVYRRGLPPTVNSTEGAASDFESLQAALRTIGFMTIEANDQILILPEALGRSSPTRVLQADDRNVSDHEIVTRIIEIPPIDVETPDGVLAAGAAQMVPILRPMLGTNAQLGAVQGTNKLVIVDRYDNVRRITRVVEELLDGR